MALTRLGWDVFTSPSTSRLTNSSWITGKVRGGDHKVVLDELCRRFNAEVEKITQAHSWGWAYRAVRGAAVISEHAAGTAVDLNAPRHPLGKSGTFSGTQVSTIHAILRDLGGVVRWGGDYAGRKDEMHFELQGGNAAVGKVADKIRGGGIVVKPAGSVKPSKPSASKPAAGKIVRKQTNSTRPNGSTTFPTDYEDLKLDKDFGAFTVGALQILLHALKRRHNKQWDGIFGKRGVMDFQEQLQAMGYYKTTPFAAKGVRKGATLKVDGGDGYWFWVAVQMMLRDRKHYNRAIDGNPKGYTIEGLQSWLNTQNGK